MTVTDSTYQTGLLGIFANTASSFPMDARIDGTFDNISFNAVPEPSTLTLLSIGILGLIGYDRRRRKRSAP